MPIIDQGSQYQAPILLRHNVAMMVWSNMVRRVPRTPYDEIERVLAPAGRRDSFFELAWWRQTRGEYGDKVVLVAPGLSGGSQSIPTRGMARALHEEGWDVAVWVFRDTGENLTTVRNTYHGYGLDDLTIAVDLLASRYTKVALVGMSLGGNMVVQYVCSVKPSPVTRAMAISPPMELGATVEYWSQGVMGRLFISPLGKLGMKQKAARKARVTGIVTSLDVDAYKKVRVAAEADHYINTEFNGYTGAWPYWSKASTVSSLRDANPDIDLLIVTAKDDLILDARSYPYEDALADSVTMELTTNGSHVGFSPRGWKKHRYWSEQRAVDHLSS
jgi:predicted alpha/beta-fold hydrolase